MKAQTTVTESGRIPVAIVAVGYAGFEPSEPKRKPVDEVADFIGEREAYGEETPEDRKIEHCDMGRTIFHDVNLYGVEISNANECYSSSCCCISSHSFLFALGAGRLKSVLPGKSMS